MGAAKGTKRRSGRITSTSSTYIRRPMKRNIQSQTSTKVSRLDVCQSICLLQRHTTALQKKRVKSFYVKGGRSLLTNDDEITGVGAGARNIADQPVRGGYGGRSTRNAAPQCGLHVLHFDSVLWPHVHYSRNVVITMALLAMPAGINIFAESLIAE